MFREVFKTGKIRKAQKESLASLFRLSPDAVFLINSAGLVVTVNDKCSRLLGYEIDEFCGMSAETFLPDLYSTAALGRRTNFLKARDSHEMGSGLDVRGKRKDESYIWLELATTPYDVDENECVLLFARDVSVRKRAEEKLVVAENRFRTIVDNAPDAMIISGRSGNITTTNKAAQEMLGFSQSELVCMRIDDLVPDVGKSFQAKMEAGFPETPTVRRLGGGHTIYAHPREGPQVPVEIFLSPIRIQDEIYTVAALRDISTQLDALQAARDSEAKARSLFNYAPGAIAVVDVASGRITEANQTAADMFEYPVEVLVGMHTSQIRPEFQPSGILSSDFAKEKYEETIAGHQTVFQWTGLTARGKEIRCENRMLLLPGEDYMAVRISAVDISDRVEMEAARAEAYELEIRAKAAEQASKDKSEFLAHISHEVRTPMNGIMGLLEVMSHSSLDGDQKELLAVTRHSAEMMLQILNDILDFSKIEAGELKYEQIPVNIRGAAEHVVAVLGATAFEKGLDLLMYVEPEVPVEVVGDPLRLRQVLFNLVGNAVKFTERGFVFLSITREKGNSPSSVRYAVSDSGIGISADELAGLFTPFSQAKASTTREFGGTGLGLTIVKNIVGHLGGHLKVDSVVGKGSTFSFVLDHDESSCPSKSGMDLPILDCRVLILGERGKRTNLITRVIEAYGGASEVIDEGWSPDAITERLAKAVSANTIFTHLYMAQEVGVDRMMAIVDPILRETSRSSIPRIIVEGGSRHDSRFDESVAQIARTPLTAGRLYAAFAIAPGQDEVEHRTSLVVSEAPSMEKARREGRLILLAEDNSTNQMVMGRQLSLLGFAHEVADNGAVALSMLRQGKYGLLLTDINMPKMDGYELALTIRQDEKEQGAETPLPIIAISAVTKGDDAGTNLPFGMDEYLSKPMKLQSLKNALDRWLPPLPGDRDADSTHSLQRLSPISTLSSHLRLEAIDDLFAGEPYDRTEILLDFQQSASGCLAKLERDFAASEMGKVTDGAHRLKSSARTVGADKMADFCQSIEQVASTGDRAEIESLVTALNVEFAVLRDDIIRELAEN